MPLYLTTDFLDDLKKALDNNFVRQVLNHTVGQDGSFITDKDDHRYEGIDDTWIRYVSQGTKAFRVIFIRKGPDIFLYRAGKHAIEANISPPNNLEKFMPVSTFLPIKKKLQFSTNQNGCFLKTSEALFIGRHIEALYHVKHKDIYLISPFIDMPMLMSTHPFGRFLDRAVEEDTLVVLITSQNHGIEELPDFKRLEERGINVMFLDRLHTKLYFFEVDLASRNAWQQGVHSQAIIGSSNLTNAGLGLLDCRANEELNCKLPSELLDQARTYISRLMKFADDFRRYEFKMRRTNR